MKRFSRIQILIILVVVIMSMLFFVNCKNENSPETGACTFTSVYDSSLYTCGTPVEESSCVGNAEATASFSASCNGSYVGVCAISGGSVYYSSAFSSSQAASSCSNMGGTFTAY